MSVASETFRRQANQIAREELRAEYDAVCEHSEKVTKALQELLGLIDDCDILERYPAIADVSDRLEKLI